MTPRLQTVAPDLVVLVESSADADACRHLAATAARFAVSTVDGLPPQVLAVANALEAQAGVSDEDRAVLLAVCEALDEATWNAQDAVDDGTGDDQVADQVFRRARAATAVRDALQEDAQQAAFDSLYEAQAASSVDQLRRALVRD